jgi:predicted MPP superfamily phosphohydrolase
MVITERQENVNLFDGNEQLSIIHLSDIHLWYSVTILERLETMLVKYNPALVALTGDYYDLPKGAYNFREFLHRISLKYTVIFIRGNHDIIYGPKIYNLLSGIAGCHCVDDAVFRYQSAKGKNYNITSWKNRGQLQGSKGEKNIILIHNPEGIKEKELDGIHLILAGHLHGGQVIFFKTKKNSNFPGSILYKYCTDRRQISDTTLIVSRGLGDTFPLRINCPKEIVRVTIV